MAEIVSKPTNQAYRSNYDRAFTRVEADTFADVITLRALRAGKKIHEFQITGKALCLAGDARAAVKPFWSNIPGLTPDEGLEATQEAIDRVAELYLG